MTTSTYQARLSKLSAFFDDHESEQRSGNTEDLRTSPLLSLTVSVYDNHVDDGSNASASPAGGIGIQLSTLKLQDDESSEYHSAEEIPAQALDFRSVHFPQWSLLGCHVGDHPDINKREPILLNTRVPASTFICGSQGSGKSYTLSCILENYIKPDKAMGAVGSPVAGLVFHYDTDVSGGVAEAASLCSLGIRTRVLAPPTSLHNHKQKYGALPYAKDNLEVMPLYFQSRHLTIERMMKLMAFSEGDGSVPLYVSVVVKVLRSLALQRPGKPLDYARFKNELENNRDFASNQSSMLRMRLELLESCLAPKFQHVNDFAELVEPGTLTIVDLSDPLVDKASARIFFDIVLAIFKQNRPRAGLVVALDEAHKFLDSEGSSGLTERLITTIREQRHVATRVIIATQEPTISPRLLDLCNVSIIHRFTSPAWLASIKSHLGAAQLHESTTAEDELLSQIMQLRIGESLVFAPSSYICTREGRPKMLQNGIMKMKTRKRSGEDQGLSKLADAIEET